MSKYPILYKGDATDFFTLGLGPIQMLKATVTQERNGIFIFEGEILTDSPLFPLVLENYLIKADADHLLKDQRFRIKRIVPNHNGKAEIYAEHVSYLSRELTIKPEVSITGSAQTALSQWKASIVEPNPFVVDSDIPTSNKTKWRIDKVDNPRMALGGVEGSILDVWGGEYRFDNYHISLLQKRGTTAKTVLAYGRNITDFEQERNIANTYTSIMPYAIYTDDKENEIVVHIDGYVVDSEHINKYPNRVVQAVNFSSEFEHDEVPTKARLLALANHYIKANEIGVPSTSIKVSFVDLSKSPDYAEYAFLEQVNLCDDVRVYYPKLGVNTVAKVIRTVWNVLTESYDEIEIGQKRMSLVGQMQQQQQAIKEINTQTNYAVTSADGKNTIFYGLYGENGLGEPKAIKVGDTWYKPNGTGTDMLVWTGTIWKVLLDAETFNEINEKIDQAEKDIAQNIIDIESALSTAEQSRIDAGFATDIAKEAKELGVTASSLAGEATTNANTAMADAQEAIRQVELNGGVVADVSAEATEAKRLAGLAEGNAQEALTKANASVTDASKALTDATKAFNKSFKSSAIAYATSTNGSTPPTTGWLSTVPTPSPDVYIWTRTTILLNDNTPVVSYSVGKIGAKGDQGLKGDTGGQGIQGVPGANAPTITSVVQQFYLSTSKTAQTGGSWLSTVPVWSSGKYYWVRVVTTYSNGTSTTSTPVLDNALNDSLVTALEVKTANQNLSTTVTQHATLIESKANSTTVDAIAGRVTTAEGSISTIAGKVELKANSTDVQTLTGRVTTAEGKITTQAGQIALKANTTDVNTLTGRVTTAEGNITTQAGLIALKANQSVVDTLTGRVSTTEAQITATDGKVTTLTTKTDGNTTSIGQLETSYSGLSSTVTQVKNNLEGMEIGGRNLIVNTESLDGYSYKTSDKYMNFNIARTKKGSTGYSDTFSATTIDIAEGDTYTASFFARTSVASFIVCHWYSPNTTIYAISSTGQVSYGADGGIQVTTSTDWKRYWVTWIQSTTTNVKRLIIGRNTITPEGTLVEISGVKIEKGNKATDWSPAPEDYTIVIAFSALEQSLDGFKTTVQNTYADKTTVNQLATSIELKANKTDVNTLTGRVTAAEGKVTTNSQQIELRATKTDVDTLTGRVSTAEGNITTQAGLIALKANATDVNTLTGRVTATEASIKVTDGKVTTLTTKTDGHTTQIGVLQSGYDGLSSTVTALETGKVGNDAFSALEQNLSGFKTTVQNTYADKTTVAQLSTQWTTTTNLANGHTSQIASLGTDLNLRATKTEVAESILADKTIKDTRTTNQLPPWYYTNYPKQKAYEFKTCATIGLPTSAGTYASVVTEVPWTDASGGTVEQTATATDGVYQRRGTTTWSAWAKVADSSNIVSQINISPESILIASAKIQIKGDTYIESGVIKTAHIADLAVSGAKIANASIASAKIISLDAAKITASSLSAITTTTGALTVTGWLTMASPNIGLLGSYNFGDDDTGAFNPRYFVGSYRFSHRYLFFSAQVYNVSNGGMGSYKYYTESFYGPDYLKLRQYNNSAKGSLYNRIDITADKLQLTNDWGTTSGIILNANGTSSYSGFAEFNNGIHVGVTSAGVGVRTARISAPAEYETLKINENRALADVTFSTQNVNFNETRTIAADFRIGKDGSSINGGRVVASMAIYNRTYSSPSNMIVTPDGVLGRSTSARKYKTQIRVDTHVITKSKKILNICPSSWFDKNDISDGIFNRRLYGFIADEFDELGLKEVVQYGSDGQVEGLAYDRISMYHNVILQDHEQQLKRLDSLNTNVIRLVANSSAYGTRLNNLESEVFRLKKRIEELEKIA